MAQAAAGRVVGPTLVAAGTRKTLLDPSDELGTGQPEGSRAIRRCFPREQVGRVEGRIRMKRQDRVFYGPLRRCPRSCQGKPNAQASADCRMDDRPE